ncbi:MAG TPA: terminase small subunit [Bacteroidales bacterium]|nr:terminase small subunit [Bacteroidales bacterium]
MKLTDKQKAFCDYYIETLNATESYKKAGYKVKNDNTAAVNANRLLRNAKIKSYIDKRLKEIENDRIADAKEVMEYLTAVMRGEVEEEVVVVESTGDYTSEARKIKKQVSVKERNKAAELLGKRYALFTDKVNIDGNVGVQIIDDIEDDTDEED